MSNTKPLTSTKRIANYKRQTLGRPLTPAQWRRLRQKDATHTAAYWADPWATAAQPTTGATR